MIFNSMWGTEQFIVNSIIPLNFTIVLIILVLCVMYTFFILQNPQTLSLYLSPIILDSHFYFAYIAIQIILEKHVHVKYYQQVFFPIIFSLGIFFLMLNLGEFNFFFIYCDNGIISTTNHGVNLVIGSTLFLLTCVGIITHGNKIKKFRKLFHDEYESYDIIVDSVLTGENLKVTRWSRRIDQFVEHTILQDDLYQDSHGNLILLFGDHLTGVGSAYFPGLMCAPMGLGNVILGIMLVVVLLTNKFRNNAVLNLFDY